MPSDDAPRLDWGAEAITRALASRLPGVGFEVLGQVDSTSTRLLERAREQAGALAPCLLVAEAQTAGRGRLGRRWASVRGDSLTFSLALPLAPPSWGGLSLAIGCALADALEPPAEPAHRPRLGLKWPNDLWLADAGAANGVGRKLGGVLIETLALDTRRVVVVGVGLNVRAPAAGLVEPPQPAAGLVELDATLDAPRALALVAPALVDALRRFETDGFAPFAAAYARRDLLRGREIAVGGDSPVRGLGAGVDSDGALLVQAGEGPAARNVRVLSGEASVRVAPAA